jgi:hypothetical protein
LAEDAKQSFGKKEAPIVKETLSQVTLDNDLEKWFAKINQNKSEAKSVGENIVTLDTFFD